MNYFLTIFSQSTTGLFPEEALAPRSASDDPGAVCSTPQVA